MIYLLENHAAVHSPLLALLGHPGMSAFGSLLGHKRTSSDLADSLHL